MNTPELNIAINRRVINKLEKDSPLWEALTTANENVSMTLAEFIDHIRDGHPFMAQHVGRRNNKNFTRSNVLAVDIDEGMNFDELVNVPFVQKFAALVYTTPSHTLEDPRLRCVFVLERDITSEEDMRDAFQGLIYKFGGDQSCKDGCRLFFGSLHCRYVALGNTLPEQELELLILRGREGKVSDRRSAKTGSNTPQRSALTLVADQKVVIGTGKLVALKGLVSKTSILCPIHEDKRPSAFVVTSKFGINGVHCHTCCATFWPPSQHRISKARSLDDYDFDEVEHIILKEQYEANPFNIYDPDEVGAPADLMIAAPTASNVFSSKYLPDFAIGDGISFVRSPKGSGKTRFLKKLMHEWKREGKKVLLIGHRQTLLRASSSDFGLFCYLNMKRRNDRQPLPDHYAISVDSIGALNPEIDKYDVVVIDEAEQVFAHLLSSTLVKKRRQCFLTLFHYLKAAKSVVVADADLGTISIEALALAMGEDVLYRFHLNQYKESRCPVYSYNDEGQLITDLMRAIETGGRYYVATNSKKKAETINKAIKDKFGNAKSVMLVTADTAQNTEVSAFIQSIGTQILSVDVTIATPTLGTGIDISFENAATLVDGVYGFFVSRVNTHFDIDQQISRVRHPKEIRVWIDPQRFFFETEVDVIKSEVLNNSDLEDFLIGYRGDGRRLFDETYMTFYAHITAMTRASKNNLKKNFSALRRKNGWTLIDVVSDKSESKEGKQTLDSAKEALEQRHKMDILNAKKIESFEYDDLKNRSMCGSSLSSEEKLSMRRHEISAFYRCDVTLDLLSDDDNGRYRDKVRNMQLYLTPLKQLAESSSRESKIDLLAPDRSFKLNKQLLLHALMAAAGLADETHAVKTDVRFSNDSLHLFAAVVKRESAKLQELFDLSIQSDVERKTVQQLGKVLKLIGLNLRAAERRKTNGVSERFYEIDESSWQKILSIVERRVEIPAQNGWELQTAR